MINFNTEPLYRIIQLPSGYWSVWLGDVWVHASLPSREAAEEWANDNLTK